MLDAAAIRRQFPSLSQSIDGRPAVFFDNPGGTQCPQGVIDAVVDYLSRDNANHGGAFATSRRSDAMIVEARRALADLFGAASPDEIVFGPNMTTLAMSVSRALGRTLSAGDEVLVTRLDHDANVGPWLHLAADRGATVRWVDIDPRKIGRTLHNAPVFAPDKVAPGNGKMLITVGTRGARDGVRSWAVQAGFREGEDFLCVT